MTSTARISWVWSETRHITPFTSFQAVQPQQSNALVGLLEPSSHQGLMGFGASPSPAKSTLVESRCCRDLMEEKFDQVSSRKPALFSQAPPPLPLPTLCPSLSQVCQWVLKCRNSKNAR